MSQLKLLLLSAATAIISLGSPVAVSATAGADGPHPYFCGKTFTLFVMRGEKVSKSEQDGAGHLLSTSHGDYVFRETDVALPVGTKPIRDDQGVKLFSVMGGGKLIGYTIAVDDLPLKVVVTGRSFTGKAQDLDFLTRFNFHPDRPQCKAFSQ
jgi:hypothetical protein